VLVLVLHSTKIVSFESFSEPFSLKVDGVLRGSAGYCRDNTDADMSVPVDNGIVFHVIPFSKMIELNICENNLVGVLTASLPRLAPASDDPGVTLTTR